MSGTRELPRFRCHPNLYELDILERFEGTCECRGRAGNTFYQGMYTTEDVDYVCLDCIATGRAAERFHGQFNAGVPRVDDPEATDELLHRTPGYVSWPPWDRVGVVRLLRWLCALRRGCPGVVGQPGVHRRGPTGFTRRISRRHA